ncbi:L,D-transpeptidase family protein [Peterkaempfera bronchialis]|uniref:YkuD domain-containing protein n=1 Tax=Peterkaempfera bronchialis TaxID=2126346 RepID=A0A345SYV5_9ACTN|nr:L,D-transpeptidase family protein [Peterkaempfera bronchialis]AXI78910.1 hypothetical protein C7M71_017310 [Peterkaempfera bronchialis]
MTGEPTTGKYPSPLGRRAPLLIAGGLALAALASGCGGSGNAAPAAARTGTASPQAAADAQPGRITGLSARWLGRIPADARQAVVVYGDAADSPSGTVTLYQKHGSAWTADATWASHNGRLGWTPSHHEDDKRSPVGVFTLTDAGGLLPDPGSKLPYHQTALFTPPSVWGPSHRHDFDYVIAIDYNRVRGSSPLDPRRPQGERAGGSIWLHLDPGSGSSACVTLPKAAMQHLLRTLDPARHPVVVMGDRATLAGKDA